MASGETLPILKEALVEVAPGHSLVCIWVFVAEIISEIILRLDVLNTNDEFMDLGHHMQRLGQEEYCYWDPGSNPGHPALW
jgi:hypothetical protein